MGHTFLKNEINFSKNEQKRLAEELKPTAAYWLFNRGHTAFCLIRDNKKSATPSVSATEQLQEKE